MSSASDEADARALATLLGTELGAALLQGRMQVLMLPPRKEQPPLGDSSASVRSNWKPDWHVSYGTELYNHSCDAEENNNRYPLIARTAPGLAGELRDRLHKGWHRNFEP